MPVYCDLENYNLYGVTDCLELSENEKGLPVLNDGKRYDICIVEYKPTKPKRQEYYEEDLMQVFAQKICVDYVFGSDCEAAIYYGDKKQRISLPVRENFQEYDGRLRLLLNEMQTYLKTGAIPGIRKGQKCSGCSMKDLCMPFKGKLRSFKSEIEKLEKESENCKLQQEHCR